MTQRQKTINMLKVMGCYVAIMLGLAIACAGCESPENIHVKEVAQFDYKVLIVCVVMLGGLVLYIARYARDIERDTIHNKNRVLDLTNDIEIEIRQIRNALVQLRKTERLNDVNTNKRVNKVSNSLLAFKERTKKKLAELDDYIDETLHVNFGELEDEIDTIKENVKKSGTVNDDLQNMTNADVERRLQLLEMSVFPPNPNDHEQPKT